MRYLDSFDYDQLYLNYKKKNPAITFRIDNPRIKACDITSLPNQFYVNEFDELMYKGKMPEGITVDEIKLPRLLLCNNEEVKRRLLGLFGENTSENDYRVLESTLKRFSDNLSDAISGRINLREFGTKHSISFPEDINFDDYCISIIFFFRITIIGLWYKNENDQIIRYYINLWLSTHVDLAIDIQGKSNDELMFNDENNDVDIYPLLVSKYPHDGRFFDANDLCDTSGCLYSSFQKNNDNKSKDKGFMAQVLHKLYRKTKPHTCLKRKFKEMVPNSMAECKEFKQLVEDLVQISLNGDYQWATIHLNFKNRCALKEMWKRRYNIFRFVKDHEFLLIFIFREFVLYNIVHCPAYEQHLDRIEKNKSFKQFIIEAMDFVRYTLNDLLNRGLFFGDDEFVEEMKSLEKKIYPVFLMYGTKTDKNPPSIVFHKKIESMSRANSLDSPEKILDIYQQSRIIVVADDVLRLGHIHLKCFFDVDRLKLLGVKAPIFNYFKFIYREFCETDAADNPLYKKLEPIMKKSLVEFTIIRFYLQKLVERYSRIRYILPMEYYSMQLFGFRKKMCFAPSIENIRYCHFCANCGNWANHVLKPDDPYLKKKITAYTLYECAQTFNGEVVCLKQKGRSKNQKTEVVPNSKQCTSQGLIKVDMIGVLQKIGPRIYCICWICGCLFELKPESYGELGPTCGNHNQKPIRRFSGNINNYAKEIVPCIYCGNNVYNRSHNNPSIGKKIAVIDNTKYLLPGVLMVRFPSIGLCNCHYEQSKEASHRTCLPGLKEIFSKLVQKSDLKVKRSSHKKQ